MKILVLQGSPNANGSTATLAHEFAAGAREAGNDVDIVDVASLEIAPCTAARPALPRWRRSFRANWPTRCA